MTEESELLEWIERHPLRLEAADALSALREKLAAVEGERDLANGKLAILETEFNRLIAAIGLLDRLPAAPTKGPGE